MANAIPLPINPRRVFDRDSIYLYHIDLRSSDVKTAEMGDWLEGVADAVRKSNNELLLYIHGFNNSFKDAIKAAAQLVVDTAAGSGKQTEPWGPRAAVAFDWASCASMLKYEKGFQADLKMGENSAPKLAQLLCDLSNQVGA